MEYRLGLILPGTRGMLRRPFPGVSPWWNECQARVGIPWTCGHSGVYQRVRSFSLSLSVCLSPSLAPFVSCEIPQALAKVQISASCFCFFFLAFFVNAKRKRGKCFANWHILFIVWFRLPNKWYSIVPLWCVSSTQSALGQDTHTQVHTHS